MYPHLRVLVVEDLEDDMLLMLRELQRGGYTLEYLRVETPAEMQSALDRQPWDIVIADYTLPDFSAPAALKLLQDQRRDLPFIIVSGTIGEETAVSAMKAGAHDYIIKGNLTRLLPAVERELREAEERQKRQRAERALRESEERFRQLAENVIESVFWIADLKAVQFLYASPAYEQIWGRSCDGLYGNFREWLEAIHPDDQQRIQTNFFEQTLPGRYDEEYRIIRPDGSIRWIRDRGFPIQNASGTHYRVVGIATDITEKKHLETQFYRAQRLESLGNLASGIAHDLNNVLTPIVAIAQLLQLHPSTLDTRSQEMLQVLEDSAKRGANMIKQILTFTRGTEGDCVPLQVVPLVTEVIKVIRQTFPKSILVRHSVPDPALGLIYADPTHLHQILMNLCVNARDAMPDGGVLTLSVENFAVDECFAHKNLDAQVGSYVLITVADTGTGIPAQLRDRIFEPFFTTKEHGQGTGLGLSTVLGIVKNYGGFVQVSSEVGEGSLFKVYLPIIEVPTDSLEQTEELPKGNGELVLIVDDDSAVQHTNQALLESHHYQTLIANTGTEAIALYTKHQHEIKVVLIDVMMPNMSGISAVRTLRELYPLIKIIAISGLSANRDPVLAAGANVFLPKPYSLEVLLQKVHDLIKA